MTVRDRYVRIIFYICPIADFSRKAIMTMKTNCEKMISDLESPIADFSRKAIMTGSMHELHGYWLFTVP